jgi:hypothetical protein
LPRPAQAADISQLKDSRVAALQGKIRRARIFAAYEQLAAIYERAGYYEQASALLREEAAAYRAKGLTDAAIIKEMRAAELDTDLHVLVDTPGSARAAGGLYTGASLEPVLGCYSGAFIDRDDGLGEAFLADGQLHRSPAQFAAVTGRNPGSLFIYLSYGRPFPAAWVRRLKAANVIPQIAWEPANLNQVRDDAYLRRFAEDLKAADWPVFIRFASEMNGYWTPYHGNPSLYRQKFRLVHRILHEATPQVATIWCVNNPPLANAFDYYPGDDGCDWVGVNFYSVPWHENNRQRPAFTENPLALLEPIYQRYAKRKPIAICEYAASHQAALDMKPIPDFAEEKLSLVYGALPLLYPRVKLIDWFDMNTMRYPMPGKTLNDYLLTEDKQVLSAWQRETAHPAYLTARELLGDPIPPIEKPLQDAQCGTSATVRVWTKTHSSQSRLWVELDGKLIYGFRKTGAHTVPLENLIAGKHTLRALLYDDQSRFRTASTAVFTVK